MADSEGRAPAGGLGGLMLGALGVVYGDIGTSPLYTLKTALEWAGGATPPVAIGMLSNGGYAVAQSVWGDPALFPVGPFSMDGFQVGGTIGANFQWGHFVLGVEADGDWAKQSGTTSRSDWLATLRARGG